MFLIAALIIVILVVDTFILALAVPAPVCWIAIGMLYGAMLGAILCERYNQWRKP